MSFVSLAFFIFLPAVFACYWALAGRIRLQNLLVVVASYVFYGWWDWRFCGLMAFSSATAYFAAIAAAPGEPAVDARRNRRRVARKAAVFSCCAVNLGILGFFKYWGFFAHEAASLLSSLGFQTAIPSLRVILPVGISFYTFQAIGYAIDAYRGRIRPAKDPVAFFRFHKFLSATCGRAYRKGVESAASVSFSEKVRLSACSRRMPPDAVGVLQETSGSGHVCVCGQHDYRIGNFIRACALDRHDMLRVPDIRGFFRIFRHRDRMRKTFWNKADAQFRVSVFFAGYR